MLNVSSEQSFKSTLGNDDFAMFPHLGPIFANAFLCFYERYVEYIFVLLNTPLQNNKQSCTTIAIIVLQIFRSHIRTSK